MRLLAGIFLGGLILASTGTARAELPLNAPPPRKAPYYRTPQEVYAARQKAVQIGDWDAHLECLTPRTQTAEIFELLFAIGMHENDYAEKYFDDERSKKVAKILHDKPGESVEDSWLSVYLMLRDPRAFYRDGSTRYADKVREAGSDSAPLTRVRIDGNRAYGIFAQPHHHWEGKGGEELRRVEDKPFHIPIFFAKGEFGWRITLPTEEDSLRAMRENRDLYDEQFLPPSVAAVVFPPAPRPTPRWRLIRRWAERRR